VLQGSIFFKFEANCLRKKYRRVVEKAWGLVYNLGSNIRCNLEGVLSSLKEWSQYSLGDSEKHLKQVGKELEK